MSSASLPSGLVPNWVGFGFALAAGIAAIVVGVIIGYAGLIAIGAWAVVSTIIAWSSGAKASPTGDPFKKSFGATVKEIDTVPWLIIAGLFVVALIIAFATAP
jgi:hypothetical protein